jgi:hypothetical protein
MQNKQRTITGALFFLICASCLAQDEHLLHFDAASLKPITPDPGTFLPYTGGPGGKDPGRVSWGQVTLRTLVATA